MLPCFYQPAAPLRNGVRVRIDRKPDWRIVAGLVLEAYRVPAPPHLVQRLDASQDERRQGWHAGWIGDPS